MSLVIVSAIPDEAAPTLEMLQQRHISAETLFIGVGPLNAAQMAQEIRRVCAGKKVLYIGSAGACYPFMGPHLVSVEQVLWSPTGERYGLAQRPGWLYPPIAVNCANHLRLPPKRVLTSTGITVTDQISECDGHEYVENMELYACVRELQESAAELSIILGITNRVGSQGRQDWLHYRTRVAELTAAAVATLH